MGWQLGRWMPRQTHLKTTQVPFLYQLMVVVCSAEIHWPHLKRCIKISGWKKILQQAKKHEDANDIQVNFNGSADLSEAKSNVVLVKGSIVLISQDDQVSGSLLCKTLAQDLRWGTMETMKTHVYAPLIKIVYFFTTSLLTWFRRENCTGGSHEKWHVVLFDFHVEISNPGKTIPLLQNSILRMIFQQGHSSLQSALKLVI